MFKRTVPAIAGNVMEPLQKLHLYDNILNAITLNKKTNDNRIIVQMAPTGSGKTSTLCNHTIPGIITTFADIKDILFVAPAVECVDEPYEILKKLDGTRIGGRLIKVFNQIETKLYKDNPVAYDVAIWCWTTHYMYSLYKNYTPDGDLNVPDLVLNDEAHRGLGAPDASTTLADFGTNNNNFDPKWFQMQEVLAAHGSIIAHFTGTPTESQQMHTLSGAAKYVFLENMPKVDTLNAFTHFVLADQLADTADLAKKVYTRYVADTRRLQSLIDQSTWDLLEPKIYKLMPGMIVGAGRDNATNGLQFTKELPGFKTLNKKVGGDIFVCTSDTKKFNTIKLKKMIDGIKNANMVIRRNNPLLCVFKDSGKLGINVSKLRVAAILRLPSQDMVFSAYMQFVARTCRMPFFRDHDAAIQFIKALTISNEQKKYVIEYYAMLSSSIVVMPNDSELLHNMKNCYSNYTFTVLAGIDYLMRGVFVDGAAGRTTSAYQGNLNSLYRKDHCEVCEIEANRKTSCYNNALKGYRKQYGPDITEEEFAAKWAVTLQVDHINGNRYDNAPDNHVTVCPDIHMVKTQINEDYLTEY